MEVLQIFSYFSPPQFLIIFFFFFFTSVIFYLFFQQRFSLSFSLCLSLMVSTIRNIYLSLLYLSLNFFPTSHSYILKRNNNIIFNHQYKINTTLNAHINSSSPDTIYNFVCVLSFFLLICYNF